MSSYYNSPCGCNQPSVDSCGSYINCGCPIELDFSCVFYHKDNTKVNQLDEIKLPNGTNLEIIIEVIDERLKQTKFTTSALNYLSQNYTIKNLQQFAQAVDSEFASVDSRINTLTLNSITPITANNSNSILLTASGTQNHTLVANVKVSSTAGNSLSILTDGLYVTPQTLNVDYAAKTLSISNGNSVNLSSLLPSSQYLGDVNSDPVTAISGNYWYNTTQNKLKIKIANTTKEILTA
jgi:hypothetical protein